MYEQVLASVPSIAQNKLLNHLTVCKQMADIKLNY